MVTPELNAKLAKRLRQLRLDHGLTQDALAERAEISPDAVRRLERGAFSPTLRLLAQVASALDMTVSDLVSLGDSRAEGRLAALVSVMRGRTEREIALVLRLARACLVEKD